MAKKTNRGIPIYLIEEKDNTCDSSHVVKSILPMCYRDYNDARKAMYDAFDDTKNTSSKVATWLLDAEHGSEYIYVNTSPVTIVVREVTTGCAYELNVITKHLMY